ncbi:MAG: hypothetical protein LBK53_09250 [Heliobacteriaceae bacterium]|jgi:hypothetical protein|nr:hypothetical protein [Heliobacteriaceae bacterium]
MEYHFDIKYTKPYIDTPQDFSRLQPKKFDELTQPTVQGVSGSNALLDQSQLIVHQPIPTMGTNKLAWMAQLGNILTTIGQVAQGGIGVAAGMSGAGTSVSAEIAKPGLVPEGPTYYYENGNYMNPIMKHTGGKSSGKDEVLAILRGGETVRTEAQEQELREEKYAQFLEAVRPYLEERNNKPKTIAEAYDPDNKIPVLLNKTTQDEDIIIATIAQAWKSNRLGFRNILRYE